MFIINNIIKTQYNFKLLVNTVMAFQNTENSSKIDISSSCLEQLFLSYWLGEKKLSSFLKLAQKVDVAEAICIPKKKAFTYKITINRVLKNKILYFTLISAPKKRIIYSWNLFTYWKSFLWHLQLILDAPTSINEKCSHLF